MVVIRIQEMLRESERISGGSVVGARIRKVRRSHLTRLSAGSDAGGCHRRSIYKTCAEYLT